MHVMHLAGLDLNLALVLHALLAERSVSRAAKRLGLSQSATSHALARLRDVLGDPLVVRTRQGITPTPRAQAMAEPLGNALGLLEEALVAKSSFDPKTAKRRFQIVGSDYAELVLMPTLVADLDRQAPHVELRLTPLTNDALPSLRRGDVDLVMGVFPPKDVGSDLRTVALWEDRFVCLVRKRHPFAQKKLTLAGYTAAKHVLIAPRGTPGGPVDDALAARGKSRTVAVTVPHFLAAPHLVVKSDLVLTVAERVAKIFTQLLPLKMLEPPLALPRTRASIVWHERHEADPAHRWLRAWLTAFAR
jgi:DNA-binding transcriptional LysR family regulator